MSFRKRQLPKKVMTAQNRLEGIRSVEQNFDNGNGLSNAVYETEIAKVEQTNEEYNKLLSQLDGLATELRKSERGLGELSQRMMNAIGSKYGYDSAEYKKAGGTPKSEKKRSAKKNGKATQAA
jgi:uncharacterized protein YukE